MLNTKNISPEQLQAEKQFVKCKGIRKTKLHNEKKDGRISMLQIMRLTPLSRDTSLAAETDGP